MIFMKNLYNYRQKNIFGTGYLELANLAIAALVFAQFLSGQGFKWGITISGLILYSFLHILSYITTKD